eukprot:gnl/TRDRNA2_/TRDRNA2_145864_c0_seq1.p1 gnl/TRDRNA2_/TRDRNA2_145864_c0~~gnl/TRDRNA2_/TRDRNA2_145864_c0_seq1.p1  ORF type:complete len:191 (-),score=6.74 gnl/TRDRNA2_/TRDRNA2_145864_c0_seq1:188-760(-)
MTPNYDANYNPLGNIDSFFCGVFVAKLFWTQSSKSPGSIDLLSLSWGGHEYAVGGLFATILLLIIMQSEPRPWTTFVVFQLHLMMIWSFAAGEDLLVKRLCRYKWLTNSGRLVVGMHFLHVPLVERCCKTTWDDDEQVLRTTCRGLSLKVVYIMCLPVLCCVSSLVRYIHDHFETKFYVVGLVLVLCISK